MGARQGDIRKRAGHAPTSHDVAERAGVSQPTVSKALRGDPSINAETRARIAEVAEELGYRVNRAASHLRTGRANVLALVVICREDADGHLRVSPFHSDLMVQIATASAAARCELLVSLQSDARPVYGQYEADQLADGVIVIGSREQGRAWEYFRALQAEGCNMVSWSVASATRSQRKFGVVAADNAEGGRLLADHLHALGRRRAVLIGGGPGAPEQFNERIEAFRERWQQLGAVIAGHWSQADIRQSLSILPDNGADATVGSAPTREAEGVAGARLMLDSGIECDALFAANDQLAIGVLHELAEAGIAVPRQIAVCGFDGIEAGQWSNPSLTTIRQDLAAAGRMLVAALLEGGPASQSRVPVHLIARDSTAAEQGRTSEE